MNQLSELRVFGNTTSSVNAPQAGFLLDSLVCKIPDIDPFDPRAESEVWRRPSPTCNQVSITYIDGVFLRINRTLIDTHFHGDFKHCIYKPVLRPYDYDFKWEYGKESAPFDKDVEISPENEHLRVVCYSKSDVNITTNYHAFITKKPEVEKRCDESLKEHKTKRQPKEIFNVQIVGIDSISRLNYMRNMIHTREFLLKELNAYEMSGYNKVEDNTFVNVVPFLTGHFVGELGWNETMNSQEFDYFNFIWKDFSQAGYRTFYQEDSPHVGTFTYGKEGMHKPPADYYLRPLTLAMYSEDYNLYNISCFIDKHETTVLLDHAMAYSKFFQNKPHFSYSFLSRLTHDAFYQARYADFMYLDFLKQFKASGLFNNTVMILFGDHGPRFGDWRKTHIGRFEERLPFNVIVFPEWFPRKYPEIHKILKINTKRLTTHFDMYETLKDILYFDGVSRVGSLSSRGISVLREIPKDRKCEHCGIAPHWCLCMEQTVIPNDNERAINVAEGLVEKINEILSIEASKCAVLTLEKVTHIMRMKSSEKVLRFDESKGDVLNKTVSFGQRTEATEMYQLSLITKPGLAQFEATVTFDAKHKYVKLEGQVSRINMYGKQSICVNNVLLKKLCFCKIHLQ